MSEILKKWAKKLNGREYREEVTEQEEKEAEEDGVVIVFGGSDDLIEFRGAICNELDVYGAKVFRLAPDGDIVDIEDYPGWTTLLPIWGVKKLLETFKKIEAKYGEDPSCSWTFKTDIPHETFEIVEEEEEDVYSCGLVFEFKSLKISEKELKGVFIL